MAKSKASNGNIERVELPDGQWWEFYTVLTRGMHKKFTMAVQGSLKELWANNPDVNLEDPEAMQRLIRANLDSVDISSATEDAWLMYGTHALHVQTVDGQWVDIVLTRELLDRLPNNVWEPVLEQMREYYTPQDEANFPETASSS